MSDRPRAGPFPPRPTLPPGESPLREVEGAATLGWGLVGASAIAAAHTVRAIRSQPPIPTGDGRTGITSARIVGIFSHSEARAQRFADAHAVPHVFVNLADLLSHPGVHCVYISNHPRHHAQSALAALAAGKHVLCEPPLALDLAEAERVAHTALSRGLVLAVNFVRRAEPAIRTLRELLAERAIGDLLGGRVSHTMLLHTPMQTWRLRSGGGGALLDRLAYSVDLLRFVLRDEIAAIQSISAPQLLGDAVEEDVVSHVMLRRNDIIFQLHDSFLVPHTPTSLEVYGSAGALVARHCLDDEGPSELLLLRHGKGAPIPLAPADPYRESIRRFLDAVRTQGVPLATGADGVQSLAAVLAAQESLRRGVKVALARPERPPVDRSIF
ncbi:MAG TPA: Gfo/Idh/MocA family oxidoreductase [Caldilineaceae bacterium]|nr:Gfo/Idh/MocA family oxidoreductase [Caldilineaceae bacterium]